MTARALRPALAVAALAFSGGVLPLISLPYGWVFLHPFSWAPALYVLARLEGRRAFLAGWLLGFFANASVFAWIVHTVRTFTNLPAWSAWVVLAAFATASGLYLGAFGWGFARVRRAAGERWPFAIAAWFTACEFLNPHLFPNPQGSVWNQLPQVFLIASLTGVPGVTFLALACNALVAQAALVARGPRRALWINAAALAVLVGFAGVWSHARLARIERAEAEVETLRIALVQPNHDHGTRRRLLRRGAGAVAADLVALSREAQRDHGPIDVFVWPEKVLVGSPEDPANAAVPAFAREARAEVWTGGGHVEQRGDGRRSTNAAFRVDATGRVHRRYDKTVLLPFGEFMPFESAIPALRRIRGPGRFTPGNDLVLYDADGVRFVFLICYEAILSDTVREAVGRGAELLVNVTYDGWFGDTTEPGQHLMMTANQAAQLGVPLVRATTTGLSAFVDARGRITARSRLFERGVLVRDVAPLRVDSPYGRWGDWFGWGCVALSALALARGGRSRRAGMRSPAIVA